MTQATHTAKSITFFNLQTRPTVGYINRIRAIRPKKGDEYLAFTFAAMNGPSDDVTYQYFNLTCVNNDAKAVIESLLDNEFDENDKILASIEISDFYADVYTNKKGEVCPKLCGRLLKIHSVKHNGNLIFDAKPSDVPSDAPAQESSDDQAVA